LALVEKNSYVASGLTGEIIGAAVEVHRQLGPGFLESVYEEALAYEFELRNISHERQKAIAAFYKNKPIKQFIGDFLVDTKIIHTGLVKE
jgi:GxxExxY protein